MASDKLAELYEHYNKLDSAKENITQVCFDSMSISLLSL